jgi:hypothetical protein
MKGNADHSTRPIADFCDPAVRWMLSVFTGDLVIGKYLTETGGGKSAAKLLPGQSIEIDAFEDPFIFLCPFAEERRASTNFAPADVRV